MLSFLVLGDWGHRGTDAQRAVAAGMARAAQRYDTDFVISTGDNFHPRGVGGLRDPHWVESFEQVYDDPALYCPWYISLGDHDHKGDVDAQCQYSQYDVRWHLPDRFYGINKRVCTNAHAQIVFLDTTPFSETSELADASGTAYDTALQASWLRHMLAPSRSEWRIVVGHHPIQSGSAVHGGTPGLRDEIGPLLRQFGVHAYLCGHENNLQHLSEDGVEYVVSGAGAHAHPTDRNALTQFSRGVPGFAVVSLSASRMVLRFCEADGTVCYKAERMRTPPDEGASSALPSDGARGTVPDADSVRPSS
jgi:hypothetical protein